jgi:hypothetical protein
MSVLSMAVDSDLTEERASIMRRQRSTSQVHLTPKGETVEMDQLHHQERDAPARVGAKASSDDPPPWCEIMYKLNEPGNNECTWGEAVTASIDCGHAADALGLTPAPDDEWWTKDEPVNPSPFIKDCYTADGNVHMNNLQSTNDHGYWNGTKICQKKIYQYGTKINETVTTTSCLDGDYEPIMNYTECLYAHDCIEGNMACQDVHFGHKTWATPLAPKGCYIDDIGCFGWNAWEGNGNKTGKSQVCKLKSNTDEPWGRAGE